MKAVASNSVRGRMGFLQKSIFISGTRLRSGKGVAAHKIAKDAI